MLYKPNIKISELTFDDLFYLMRRQIEFHCKNNLNLIKGYDYDDLFQELSYKLWKARIPDDIIYFDYRFMKYINKMFINCLYDLQRKQKIQIKPSIWSEIPRDLLNECVFFAEMDKL